MLRYFVPLLLCFPSVGFSTVKVTGVAGASHYDLFGGSVPVILGGRGGSSGTAADCESGDGLNTCNGCALANSPMVCNRNRIYPSLRLRITIVSDSKSGRPFLGKPGQTSFIELEARSIPKGSSATIDVPWSTVCSQLSGGSYSCDPAEGAFSAEARLVVGIDSNNDGAFSSGDESTVVNIQILDPDPDGVGEVSEISDCIEEARYGNASGICGLRAFPGDGRAFLEDVEGGLGFPMSNTGAFSSVHVYYQTGSFENFSPASTPYVSLAIEHSADGRLELANSVLDDLENETPYYLRVSSVDKAGNEMYFTSDHAIQLACGSLNPNLPFNGIDEGDNCPFAVIPSSTQELGPKVLR